MRLITWASEKEFELHEEEEVALLNELIAALDDDHAGIRCAAVRMIAALQFRPSLSVRALCRALRDDGIWERKNNPIPVRNEAMFALGEFGVKAKDAISDILQLLTRAPWSDRFVAISILGEIGVGDDRVLSVLREVATNPDRLDDLEANTFLGKTRRMAVRGLGKFGIHDPRVSKVLFYLANDELPLVRLEVVAQFARVEHPSTEIVDLLLDAVTDGSWRVRYCAVQGLSSVKPMSESVEQALLCATQDENTRVREEAKKALGKRVYENPGK